MLILWFIIVCLHSGSVGKGHFLFVNVKYHCSTARGCTTQWHSDSASVFDNYFGLYWMLLRSVTGGNKVIYNSAATAYQYSTWTCWYHDHKNSPCLLWVVKPLVTTAIVSWVVLVTVLPQSFARPASIQLATRFIEYILLIPILLFNLLLHYGHLKG